MTRHTAPTATVLGLTLGLAMAGTPAQAHETPAPTKTHAAEQTDRAPADAQALFERARGRKIASRSQEGVPFTYEATSPPRDGGPHPGTFRVTIEYAHLELPIEGTWEYEKTQGRHRGRLEITAGSEQCTARLVFETEIAGTYDAHCTGTLLKGSRSGRFEAEEQVEPTHHEFPYIPRGAKADSLGMALVRIVNRSDKKGTVALTAINSKGQPAPVETLTLRARGSLEFTTKQMEEGAPGKGLTGVGPGDGHWRLVLSSTLDIVAVAYLRSTDGFLERIDQQEAPRTDGEDSIYTVHVFHPAKWKRTSSRLRLVNSGTETAEVTITGFNAYGTAQEPVTLKVHAGKARFVTSKHLEEGGRGLEGSMGAATGRYHLHIRSTQPLGVLNLMHGTDPWRWTGLSGKGETAKTPPPPAPPPSNAE